MMALHGLYLGNDYPGTSYELPDCVIDSERMYARMEPYLSDDSELLRNEECTLANITKILRSFQKAKKKGNAFVVYNSGHGTTEGNKQGIVLHGGFVLWEQQIRELLKTITPAVLISDSCFAGGLRRAKYTTTSTIKSYTETPTGFKEVPVKTKGLYIGRYVPFNRLRKQMPPPTGRLPKRLHDYFAGCDGDETAASTGDGGAFTNEVVKVLDKATPRLTMVGIHRRVRKVLPNDEYDQTPQFYATDKGFSRRTLASFMKG